MVYVGGYAREAVEAVRAVNRQRPTWELLGFLDDREELAGAQVDGLSVLGPVSAVERYGDAQVLVCAGHPGDPFARWRLVRRLDLPPDRYATVVHPAAVVPPSCEVGPGTVLLAGVVATTNVRVGAHVAVEAGVVLSHDDVVASYATLGPGARLAGTVRIGQGAYLGAGAVVHQERAVGRGRWSAWAPRSWVTCQPPRCGWGAGRPARARDVVAVAVGGAAEREFLTERAGAKEAGGGYSHIQRTRPQTLAYGLADSPAGLAA